jgi:26S proteasome regulatory subunit T1
MTRIFSYAFTTAGRGACGSSRHGYGRRHNNDHDGEKDQDTGAGSGSYAAQYIGGSAAVESDMGALGGVGLFGEITGKGVQTGLGTIAGLGLGLPMSRLYAQ